MTTSGCGDSMWENETTLYHSYLQVPLSRVQYLLAYHKATKYRVGIRRG